MDTRKRDRDTFSGKPDNNQPIQPPAPTYYCPLHKLGIFPLKPVSQRIVTEPEDPNFRAKKNLHIA